MIHILNRFTTGDISKDACVSFCGNIIASIIGGLVAFYIMKCQLKSEKKQAKIDRDMKIKVDVQLDIYKQQLVPILNDFIYNIFIQNMNLELIKNALIRMINNKNTLENINHTMKILKKFEGSMIEGTEFNRKFDNINNNFQLIIGASLYEKSKVIEIAFYHYNYVVKQLYSNIDNIINYIIINKDWTDVQIEKYINMINKNFIDLYNEQLVILMNKLYGLLNEYCVNSQNEFLSSVFNEKVKKAEKTEPFKKIEYISFAKASC